MYSYNIAKKEENLPGINPYVTNKTFKLLINAETMKAAELTRAANIVVFLLLNF